MVSYPAASAAQMQINDNQREMLISCLTQIFGRTEDEFVDAVLPNLSWIELKGGETLFEQGDPENGVYLVIGGRLRAMVRQDDGSEAVREIVQGQTVGELAVLTHEPRSATVRAIRDSVLAHVSRETFEELSQRHPAVTLHIARVIIDWLRRPASARPARPKTMCLVAITEGVDAVAFGERLVASLKRWGVAQLETSSLVDGRFGPGTAQSTGADGDKHHRLTMWLDDLEFWNEYVVFATDGGDSEWTRRAIRHADRVLLLARAGAAAVVHPLEEKYLAGPGAVTAAEQTLVLLHEETAPHPARTAAWLARRPVGGHIHVRPAREGDLARLSRILSGNAGGLVLAGGGARGFAHLGVYRALEELGIAVDLVGGTSMGAAMAALIASGLPSAELLEHARRAFARGPTSDLNLLPILSLIRGRRLERVIDDAIVGVYGGRADVSDTWRGYFCVASNFSRSREMVLTRGDLARCIRASVSIPIAFPPVVHEGDLLFDGGTFNNFPVDVMAAMGAGRIVGVDLHRPERRSYDLPEVPGPLALLVDRLRPRARRKHSLPNLATIMAETSVLYSNSRRATARQAVSVYINPDLAGFGLLEWTSFDQIVEVGYRKALAVLEALPAEELALYRDLP